MVLLMKKEPPVSLMISQFHYYFFVRFWPFEFPLILKQSFAFAVFVDQQSAATAMHGLNVSDNYLQMLFL